MPTICLTEVQATGSVGLGVDVEPGGPTGRLLVCIHDDRCMDITIDPGSLQESSAADSLRIRVQQFLQNMDGRKRAVLERRMGLMASPESLADIAQTFDLSRERIRQLEVEAVQELSPLRAWFQALTHDLAQMLRCREYPLTFLGAVEVDPRLHGMARYSTLMAYLLQRWGAGDVHMVYVRHVAYLLSLSQRDWETFCTNLQREFRADKWAGAPVSVCKRYVLHRGQGLLRGDLELCWQEIGLSRRFVASPQGLVLKPATYAGWVRYVLANADEPMSLTDIQHRIQEVAGKSLPAKSIHKAITHTAIVFNRGMYGLEQHIPIAPDQIPPIIQVAEQQVLRGPPARQWHVSELLTAVLQKLGPLPGLTKYILNYVLQDSQHLQSLNRMVWHQKATATQARATRIHIRDAIIAILEEAGCPLSAQDIYTRLITQRGLDQDLNFQIHAGGRLVHLASGLWGIKERDDPPPLFTGTTAT